MPQELKNGTVPHVEGHIQYSSSTITEEMRQFAALKLNETEETRKKGIQEIKDIISKERKQILEEDIPEMDHFLVGFLRSRKFDIEKTEKLIRKGFKYMNKHRELFDRVDSKIVRQVIRSNMIGFLPYRDSEGSAIVYANAAAWNPDEIAAKDCIFGGIVSMHTGIDNPVNQITGFVVILDLKKLTMKQVMEMAPYLILGTKALQRCLPCRIKKFHVVNIPDAFKTGWKMVKPLLSEKIKKRFILHKRVGIEKLHEYIPPAILPSELGGQLGPFSNDYWAPDVDEIEKLYYHRLKVSHVFD